MPSHTYSVAGIVLHRTLLGEADKILTIYTREHGKLGAVAKGVRKPKSRLTGVSELFICARYLMAKGRSLDIVSQGEIEHSFSALRMDLELLTRATYMCELLDRLTLDRDESASADLYDLTLGALMLLQRASHYPDGVVHAYELHLLGITGYAPALDRCSRCGRTLEPKSSAFSAHLGGMLCADDRHFAADATLITSDAISLLRMLRDDDPSEIVLLNPAQRVRFEAARAMRASVTERIDRRIKSADFLEELRNTAKS